MIRMMNQLKLMRNRKGMTQEEVEELLEAMKKG